MMSFITPFGMVCTLYFLVPHVFQQLFLRLAHENSGHQGAERTLSRLYDAAYWVGMAKSVVHHCKVCIKCQFSKALPPKPLPLQPILATRPWEMVGVDVLKSSDVHQGKSVSTGCSGLLFQVAIHQTYARSESSDYCEQLKTKLALLREMVDTNLVESSAGTLTACL